MDTELILTVSDIMYRENFLTKKGMEILYNIHCDPYHEYIYYSVVLRMTELYGEWVDRHGQDKSAYQRLRKNAVDSYIRLYTIKRLLSLEELRTSYILINSAFAENV